MSKSSRFLLSLWPLNRPIYLRGSRKRSKWGKFILATLTITTVIHILDNCHFYREKLKAKYTPTIFSRISSQEVSILQDHRWEWNRGEAFCDSGTTYCREDIFNQRAAWNRLGKGYEGETFRHQGLVIKVFQGDSSPFRNCVPESKPELRWPTEIAASVIVGGLATNDISLGENSTFLPVIDYFLSPGRAGQDEKWHLVTPFLPSGNLKRLARGLRDSGAGYTSHDIDLQFRPSMDRLLSALGDMHREHNLCHDDVKLSNIFLGSSLGDDGQFIDPTRTTHWVLGDLGNVREQHHPYHSSTVWTLSGNLPDCRENDVFRLIKVYLRFLRRSVRDVEAFDREFFEASQNWSKLFWSIWHQVQSHQSLTTATALQISADTFHKSYQEPQNTTTIAPQSHQLRNPLARLFMGDSRLRSRAVKKMLRVSASDAKAKAWGLVSLLGVPKGACAPPKLRK